MKRLLFILLSVLSLVSYGQGIILKSTSEQLEVLTSSTADIDYQINWADIVLASGATPGSSEGKITTAGTTTIVAAPAASTYRLVKSVTLKNIHASTTNSLTIKKDISATEYQLTGVTDLQAGESLMYNDAIGWRKFTAGGVMIEASISFQVDIQTFSSTGTWTKPTNFTPRTAYVKMWGAGGGGGAGASLATAVVAKGGGGGGGGCFTREFYDATDLTATVAVTIGTGGSGGAPGAAGAAGGNGGIGGNTSFGAYATAFGGGGGNGGAITAVATGGGGG